MDAKTYAIFKSVNGQNQSLAGYATEDYVNNHHDTTKQDTLTAGENITIENNVISATGGTTDPTVISAAVRSWLDDHPEATTTVQDGSITPVKTTFLEEINAPISVTPTTTHYAISNNGQMWYHGWLNNNTLVVNVSGMSKVAISAHCAYINWVQLADEPNNTTTQAKLAYGGTSSTPNNIDNRDVSYPLVDCNQDIAIVTGANYLLVDMGRSSNSGGVSLTNLVVSTPSGVYKPTSIIDLEDAVNGATQDIREDVITIKTEGAKPIDGSVNTDSLSGVNISKIDITDESFINSVDDLYWGGNTY